MNIRMFPGHPEHTPSHSPVSASPAAADRSSAVVHLDSADRRFLLRRQAVMVAKQGDYDAAIALFDELIAQNPSDPNDYNNRGLVHYKNGDLETALKDYNRALQIAPESAKVYNNRANCYIALGQLEEAIADYDTAIDLNPTNLHALLNQGITFRDLGQYEAAIENFELGLQISQLMHSTAPTAIEARLYAERGRTFQYAGDWNCAVADFHRVLHQLDADSSLRAQVEHWLNQLLRPLSA